MILSVKVLDFVKSGGRSRTTRGWKRKKGRMRKEAAGMGGREAEFSYSRAWMTTRPPSLTWMLRS